MYNTGLVALGLLIPFFGTSLGAGVALLLRREPSAAMQKLLLGFAAGVMIAASVWSLLIPAIAQTQAEGGVAWMPALIGFLLGIGFLLLLDSLIPHMHLDVLAPEGRPSELSKSTMLTFAVTLHNIPEGMAVGVVFAGVLAEESGMSLAAAFVLAVGIAVQNVPEGTIVSIPLRSEGCSRGKAFGIGVLSGAVEPLAALLTILLTAFVLPLLPYLLSFAAGAMLYVVVEELIPASQMGAHSNIGTIGVALGFALMMVLDVSLG